jgi:hypothetical protein
VREGQGTLYKIEKDSQSLVQLVDQESQRDHKSKLRQLMRCIHECNPYLGEDPKVPDTLVFLTYDGPWKRFLPHTVGQPALGIQHCKGEGIYIGDFNEGKRDGRGIWMTYPYNDPEFKYKPLDEKTGAQVRNWQDNKMHGIAVVETRTHVHEKVIYTQNKCQMPFTTIGPPVTEFDKMAGVGTVVRAGRAAAQRKLFSEGVKAPQAKDAQLDDTVAAQDKLVHTSMVDRKFHKKMHAIENSELLQLREPTEVNLPDEDVKVSGATYENSAMNGLYFRLPNTFGVPIYRMVKYHQSSYLIGHLTERYLFKDPKTKFWVISEKAMGRTMKAGCGYVDDGSADHPSTVKSAWTIWHEATSSMRSPDQDNEDDDPQTKAKVQKNKVDRLFISSVVGFVLRCSDAGDIVPGLMLRAPYTKFNRPVYEHENGKQWLYWMPNKVDMPEDNAEEALALGMHADGPHKLLAQKGCWIISKGNKHGTPLLDTAALNGNETGLALAHSNILAFSEDSAITPDSIKREWRWKVRVQGDDKQNTKAWPTGQIVLEIEEMANNKMLASLDDDFDEARVEPQEEQQPLLNNSSKRSWLSRA